MSSTEENVYLRLRELFPDILTEEYVPKKEKRVNRIPIECYTVNWEYVATYESTMDAERKTGVSARHIAEVCCGYRKTAGGYMWRRKAVTQEELDAILKERKKNRKEKNKSWYESRKQKEKDFKNQQR